MNKHFDYLMKDESEDFFQKVAFREAGIAPARPAPHEMAKQASAMSSFEKVASRLDRDMGILKQAGAYGRNFGMYKRAGAYMEVILTNANLSPEEFGAVFDKVAASAIETDLQQCWDEISPGCPDSHLGWLESEFAKIGFNLAVEATSYTVFGDVLDDIEQQIDRFIFSGFISAVGNDRLDDVRRYLDAVVYRLEKLRENPDRDRERMERVTELDEELDHLTDVLSWSNELVDAAWMLQELRVSLFAQPIGVKGTISEKRIRKALEDLLR
jgi:hypothetical protein